MKRAITFLIFTLLFPVALSAESLPSELWQGMSGYSYNYLTAPKQRVSTVAFHSDKLLAEYDFQSMQLKALRLNGDVQSEAEALRCRETIAEENLDLLQINLIYKGKRYRLNHGCDMNKLFKNQIIESGRLFQHRYIVDLGLEEGAPKMDARLHISMWSDKISFDVDMRPLEDIGSKWDIEIVMKRGEGLYYSSYNKMKESEAEIRVSGAYDTQMQFAAYRRLSCTASTASTTHKELTSSTSVAARDIEANGKGGRYLRVEYDSLYRCYRVKMNNRINSHHALNRVKISLSNSSAESVNIPIMFDLAPVAQITGVTAILRDMEQNPIGIPVQISKNWHTQKGKQFEYQGPWFHGFTVLTLPAKDAVDVELTMASAYWGRVPAASHAQLSLAGYSNGGNGGQLWDQSAIGAFGESICYEPDQGMGWSFITDVRPFLARDPERNNQKWAWSTNTGGADFVKVSSKEGDEYTFTKIKSRYKRYGPNMTEVIYSGELDGGYADVEISTSVARSDDYVRGTYKIRFEVKRDFEFSQLALFQLGAEGYSVTHSKKFAVGDERGLIEERDWTPGSEEWKWRTGRARQYNYTYRSQPIDGEVAWVSMHDAFSRLTGYKYTACRGFVVREWSATVGGESLSPSIAERSIMCRYGGATSVMELTLPESVTKLSVGDVIEADVTMLILPMMEGDTQYYGPNIAFKEALTKGANTAAIVEREARSIPKVSVKGGELLSTRPITIKKSADVISVSIEGGIGFVPLVIRGVEDYRGVDLNVTVNGRRVDLSEQAHHGGDYWQCDYDVESKSWDLIYNVPLDDKVEYLPIN